MQEASPLLWSASWTGISLIFLIVVCFQYDSVLSVYVKECNDEDTGGGGQCVYIPLQGVGFFSAGYLANGATVPGARLGDNRVLWSDLTTENACLPGTDVFEHYSKPLSLCVRIDENDISRGYRLVLPSHIQQLQMDIQITLASAVLSLISAIFYICLHSYRLAITSIGMSATAVLGSLHCIQLWMSWKGTELYTTGNGFYIPLWAANGAGKEAGSLMVERFRLEMYNPQFQLLVAAVPSFAVGMIGTTCVLYHRMQLTQRQYESL